MQTTTVRSELGCESATCSAFDILVKQTQIREPCYIRTEETVAQSHTNVYRVVHNVVHSLNECTKTSLGELHQ